MKVNNIFKRSKVMDYEKKILIYKKFIITFLKNPFKIGALIPSSEELSEMITEMAQLSEKKCVVELGPGTGVFTEKILEKINPQACFFGLELNLSFVKETQKRCPEATIYHSSAENIQKYLILNHKKNCDTIISGIPWTLFDNQAQEKILSSVYNAIEIGGDFLTFVYVSGVYLPGAVRFSRILKKKFKTVNKSKIIWKNVPPVFVYHCKK